MDFSAALNQTRFTSSSSPEQSGPSKPSEKSKAPRATRACDNCRKRKSRCSGGTPEQPCKECITSGKSCTFEPIKRRPPKNYAESLEWRVESMEQMLRKIGPKGGTALLEVLELLDDEDLDDEDKTTAIEKIAESLEAKKNSFGGQRTGTGIAYEEDVPFEYQNYDSVRYIGRSSGPSLAMNLLRLTKGTTDPFERTPSLVDQLVDLDRRRITEDNSALPPPDLAAILINAYFTHFNAATPLLHRPSFERALQSGLLESDVSFRCLVLAIFAIGSRFVDDKRIFDPPSPTGDTEASAQARGFYFFQSSMSSITSILIPASLFDLQWSVLATCWLLGTSTPVTVWSAIGFSVRRGIDVGAHVKQRNRWTASPLEDQLRKRAFHSLVALDRHVSATIGRPMAIQDWEWDLEYPLDIADEDLDNWNLRGPLSPPPKEAQCPSALAGMISQFKLQHIMGRTLTAIYGVRKDDDESAKTVQEIVTDLDSSLNQWQGQVPEHLRWSSAMKDSPWLVASAQLNTQFYLCQSLIHRDFIAPTRAKLHSLPSFAICSNAARSIVHIMEILREIEKLDEAFWYLPLAGGAAGIILLAIMFAQPLSVNVKESSAFGDVHKCLASLNHLRKKTAMGNRCYFALLRLVEELERGRQPVPEAQSTMSSAPTAGPPLPVPSSDFLSSQSSFTHSEPALFPLPLFDSFTGNFATSHNGLTTPSGTVLPPATWDFITKSDGADWASILGGGFNIQATGGGGVHGIGAFV